jgi:hypothetical protein
VHDVAASRVAAANSFRFLILVSRLLKSLQ